jgi:hypothetical protein
VSDPATPKPPPTTVEPAAETRPTVETKPATPTANARIQVEQVAWSTAQTVGRGAQALADAAAQVSPWQYLAVLLRILGLAGLFVVYQTIEAEGLREIFGEVVGKRLSKASALVLGWMDDFEQTHKLDMANALAAAFLLFTYLSWEAVIYRVIHRPEGESLAERYLVLVPALVLMTIDTILFTVGVYANGSFSSPIPAVMLALGYDAMLILFSYWVVKIERRNS